MVAAMSGADEFELHRYQPSVRTWLERLYRGLSGPGPAPSYVLMRFVLLRVLGLVCVAACLSAVLQLVPLVGSRGITPMAGTLVHPRGAWSGFFAVPTVFWFDASDAALLGVSAAALVLSALLLFGLENAGLLLVLWGLYLSVVHVGGHWYGFGWEILLLETLVLAALLCPLGRVRPLARDRPPPLISVVLMRWLAFRVMLGAGLIKLRGDACWTELTCLGFHFETQPNPGPLSWWFDHLPDVVQRAGVVFNHVAELVLPWLVFGPRRPRIFAGLGMIAFQGALILSGNLAFLNWLTIVPCIACFDDQFLMRVLPRRWGGIVEVPATRASRVTAGVFAAVVAWLSIDVVINMMGRRQAMNASFDRLHLVNTYGAFGTVTTVRHELELEGTDAASPEGATWQAYTFRCKPGDPLRRPCWVSPYHLRLDWVMWFAAIEVGETGGLVRETWVLSLVDRLLAAEPGVLGLLESAPVFASGAPTFVRVEVYRYRFTDAGEDGWWHRERVGSLVRAVGREDPELRALVDGDAP